VFWGVIFTYVAGLGPHCTQTKGNELVQIFLFIYFKNIFALLLFELHHSLLSLSLISTICSCIFDRLINCFVRMCIKVFFFFARILIAISSSRTRSRIQHFGLQCKLYIKPFFNNAIALKEKAVSVLWRIRNGTFNLVVLNSCDIYRISGFFFTTRI